MKVLFVCRGNVARSQEAAAFYNALTGTSNATSAGIQAIVGKPLDPLVLACMAEAGHDMAGCARKQLTEQMLIGIDQIVTFVPPSEIGVKIPAVINIVYWDVSDPRGQDVTAQRLVRDQIQSKIEAFIGA